MDNISPTDPDVMNEQIEVNRTTIPFKELGYFSKIILDYLDENETLQEFYEYPVSFEGIREAIKNRKQVNTDRHSLVQALEMQYSKINVSAEVKRNINRLSETNTFTITTAHQPNIFTGYLYFIYKILHTIKLAATLNEQFPGNYFVPVYYMGSEDADLDELGNIYMDGDKTEWKTDQKGAVGRMKTKGLEKIIERIDGELSIQPFGKQLSDLLKRSYLGAENIQSATLALVNELFASYGLIILIPDTPVLKKAMHGIFLDELLHQTASSIVQQSIEKLSGAYKVQATPREINLFYLNENTRERIVKVGQEWKVIGTAITFNEETLTKELNDHPERFSPNVILRGLFQETILPNLAFIGGGGELAYWLELKQLFRHYHVLFPVLILRNSFLIIEHKWNEKMQKLGFNEGDLFKKEIALKEQLVKKNSSQQLELDKELEVLRSIYQQIKAVTARVDKSLDQHVEALETRAAAQLKTLEKKMLKAEKKKFESQLHQLDALRKKLFPNNNLQERVDNFMPYYARYGPQFIEMLYDQSPDFNKSFIILTQKNNEVH